jgi:hypothetical protein
MCKVHCGVEWYFLSKSVERGVIKKGMVYVDKKILLWRINRLEWVEKVVATQ